MFRYTVLEEAVLLWVGILITSVDLHFGHVLVSFMEIRLDFICLTLDKGSYFYLT